jgi:hypothetical protein
VSLNNAEKAFIRNYGNGNISAGISAMVRVCRHLSEHAARQRQWQAERDRPAPGQETPSEECEHGTVGKCPTCVRDDFLMNIETEE